MNYLSPATSITAAHWNDIFQAADAWLHKTLGGMSAVLIGSGVMPAPGQSAGNLDLQWDRGFFFFDPLTVSASALHPMAQGMLQYYWGFVPIQQQVMFLRKYNHGAITSLVGGLSTSSSPSRGVQPLGKPTWATWSAAIYPSGFGSYSPGTLYETVGAAQYPTDNMLDCSLGVIRYGGNAVTFNDATTAEHAQPLKAIDVFINADLSWDTANWDKYSVVRVHNCGRSAHGAFGTAIQSGGSRCFRKISGAWVAQGYYFHWMQSGDGRFLFLTETNSKAGASIFNPGIVADVIQRALFISTTNFGGYADPLKMWDASSVLNNPSYTPTPTEKTPPAGGYCAPLSGSSLLGDLLVHRGQVLAFKSNSSYPSFGFTGFGSLATALSGAGVSTRSITQDSSIVEGTGHTVNNLEIYSSTNLHLVDLSSPLMTFINSGNNVNCPAGQVGASQTSSPKSLTLPWLVFSALDLEPVITTSNYYYNDWAVDSNGNYYVTDMVTVALNRNKFSPAEKRKVFLPTDSDSVLTSWIGATGGAGGVLTIGNCQLLSTSFGPVQQWDEAWPCRGGFAGLYSFQSLVHSTRVIADQSAGNVLRVTRSIFLQDAINNGLFSAPVSPIWPRPDGGLAYGGIGLPPLGNFLKWNFPRTDQQYQLNRWYHHNPADAPMIPDWSSYTGSAYANFKYENQLIGFSGPGNPGWWESPLDQSEFNVVVSFYETNPISVDTAVGFTGSSSSSVHTKNGISAMRAWTSATDAWGPFAAWLGGAGSFSWTVAPDLGGTASGSLVGSNLVSAIESGSAGVGGQNTPNALPCQCEQFNALASLVAATPPAKWNAFNGIGNIADGANIFPTYQTGVQSSDLSLSPEQGQLVSPRAAFYCWQTSSSGPDPIAAYLSGLGAAIQTTPVFGTGSTGSISWISIDDARAIYANFGFPFTLDVMAYPVSWVSDPMATNGGYFKNDPNGGFLQLGFAWDGHGTDGYTILANTTSAQNDPTRTMLDWAQGIMQPVPGGSTYPPYSLAGSYLCIIREGLPDLCVMAIPLNFVYQNPAAVNQNALQALGASIIPIFADNSVEGAEGEMQIIPGNLNGGSGQFGDVGQTIDHVITTGLVNAQIQTVPIDGWVPPPAPGTGL